MVRFRNETIPSTTKIRPVVGRDRPSFGRSAGSKVIIAVYLLGYLHICAQFISGGSVKTTPISPYAVIVVVGMAECTCRAESASVADSAGFFVGLIRRSAQKRGIPTYN